MADVRLVELLLEIRALAGDLPAMKADLATVLQQVQAMTVAFDTLKSVFEYLLAERTLLKEQLAAALGNDAADAAKLAAAEEALAAAGLKVTELQALADTDTAEDQALLDLVKPITDEIAAQTPPEEPAIV
jgi:hypothetical protein